MSEQQSLFDLTDYTIQPVKPFRTQLLKWIGNKQRFAHEIIQYFPQRYGMYYEPFLGSGAVLGTLAPESAVASDSLQPLIEIWQALQYEPETLKQWYEERWDRIEHEGKELVYEQIKVSFNTQPSGADFIFLARSCYGGVVRFTKDGYMSTPCGIHTPISPQSFSKRVDLWHERVDGAVFMNRDFEEVMDMAQAGDLIYCDPPYSDSQSILYGAQSFSLARLFDTITRCKERGVYVIVSIDGTKKTGKKQLQLPIPAGLFEHEAYVNCGRSMLKRFQMEGQTLEEEEVTDRLLLTY